MAGGLAILAAAGGALAVGGADAWDLAGIAALLAVMGAAAKYLFDNIVAREGRREADLTKREIAYREKIEAQVGALESRLDRVERAYGVVIGIVHVWVDEIGSDSASLPVIAAQLRMAFPVAHEMPADLQNLVGRLEAKKGKRP